MRLTEVIAAAESKIPELKKIVRKIQDYLEVHTRRAAETVFVENKLKGTIRLIDKSIKYKIYDKDTKTNSILGSDLRASDLVGLPDPSFSVNLSWYFNHLLDLRSEQTFTPPYVTHLGAKINMRWKQARFGAAGKGIYLHQPEMSLYDLHARPETLKGGGLDKIHKLKLTSEVNFSFFDVDEFWEQLNRQITYR